MEKEIELLSRVAANHLILGQFEPLRASLLSLQKRRPDLALAILRRIVSRGGRIDDVLWSSTLSSPSLLAWLSALELCEFENDASIWRFDPDLLRLKVEFLLLVELVSCPSSDLDSVDGNEDGRRILNQVLDLGLCRLRNYVGDDDVALGDAIPAVNDDELKYLWKTFLDHAEIFDALCLNIQRQLRFSEMNGSQLAITVCTDANVGLDSSFEGSETLVRIQQNVQLAHLDALKESLRASEVDEAVSHLRFLHLDYGVEETVYKPVLQDLVKMGWLQLNSYGETCRDLRNKMTLMYAESLSSNCIQVVRMIQAIEDDVLSEKNGQYRVSDANSIPLPLQKYLNTLTSENVTELDVKDLQSVAAKSCIRDLYHYARISGIHILECVMTAALSAVKREQLQEASNVLSVFPLLQPLVAVLGWDLLPGKTSARRKLMQLLWTSKSQMLRLEEFPLYRKQSDEVSCIEYMCDLLCFHLDLASFVACINSGQTWNSKASLIFSQNEQIMDEKDTDELDPFVENFILERLATQSPIRVLFDVVPGIKFHDAIELISLQPIASTSAAWKRMQDIELMHMRYALESAVLALGFMEQYLGDENKSKSHSAIWHLKDLQNHLEAVTSASRKIFMVSIIMSLLNVDSMPIDLISWESSHGNPVSREQSELVTCEGGNRMVVSFTGLLLDILHHNLTVAEPELEHMLSGGTMTAGKQALEWRLSNAKSSIEDWEWRLSIMQRLEPFSERPIIWKEALVVLRAAPSKLLNL